MPAPATTDELLGLIGQSGLFEAERVEACATWAMLDGGMEGPAALAAALVRAGLLTQFHAEQFMLGKYRGFTIGKFRVMERIGFGGMGIVYLCEHQVMRHKVAIKVLPTSKNDNPAALGRFYREARAAAALDHPNLVRAHDVDHEGNIHYLVMDYVDGASLQQIVHRCGPLAASRAAHYIGQAALGLEHARQAGLVHRDIKPGNIIVDRAGTARILDLGLARFYDDETDMLTIKYDENNVLGTADYVSPEQAVNSHKVDTRTDIYSLGCTFYFLLTGHPPFPEGKPAQKLVWHQTREPQAIRSLRPEVPETIAAVVARMMAKDQNDRHQTPGEVAMALEPWLRGAAPAPTAEELPPMCPAAARGVTTPPEMSLGPVTPVPGVRAHGSGLRPAVVPGARTAKEPPTVAASRPPRPWGAGVAEMSTPHALASTTAIDSGKGMALQRPPRPQAQLWAATRQQAQETLEVVPEAAHAEPSFIVLALRLGLLLILGILATAGARWVAGRLPRPSWLAAEFLSWTVPAQSNPSPRR